ncbi:MAG: hypothetical protein QOF66_5637 [Mycobacterium sp.]|nr:gluconolaconase [Mycobacterium sp.]MDT5057271.1 hypothetical protein [Mycobacterium sp.]
MLVTADGTVRRVAEGIAFPNGITVTPGNSTLIITESFAGTLSTSDIGSDGGLSNRRVCAAVPGDRICLDTEGVWTHGFTDDGPASRRVAEGGGVLDSIPLDPAGFACMLAGPDGRTLFMVAVDWRIQVSFEDNIERLTAGPKTGQLLTARAPAPPAGHPRASGSAQASTKRLPELRFG